MKSIHRPILPEGEVRSLWDGVVRFVPSAAVYSVRHLTLGAWLRLRRRVARWLGTKYSLS